MIVRTSGDVSRVLSSQLKAAMEHPKDIYGFADYGPEFPVLNHLTGGLQQLTFSVMGSRPKVGKSTLASQWVVPIAEQAKAAGMTVRIVTLETTRERYQQTMAATMAGVKDPTNIRRGKLLASEAQRYLRALDWLGSLPIEYLSNQRDLEDRETMLLGRSNISYGDIERFLGLDDTFWWVLDHIGLIRDLSGQRDNTTRIFDIANALLDFSHRKVGGLAITHLTRESVGGGEPGIESFAGSDQVGRNGDELFLLWRPYFESRDLSEADMEEMRRGDPATLKYYSRNGPSGRDFLYWDAERASFLELQVRAQRMPVPSRKKRT